MIGDPSHQISRIFDVLDEEQGLAQRGTFIIDPDGIVQAMEINADGIGRDASALIDKIRAAQYVRTHPGEVCPAKWKESGETLKPSFDLVGKIQVVDMLDKETKQNLEQYLALIESPIVFSVSLDTSENSQKLAEFTKEIAEMSPKIS